MNVAIVGAGRVGSVVAPALAAAGVPTVLVARGQPIPTADVYWLTVRDGEIHGVSSQLPESSVRIHSAGALSIAALGGDGERAVIHPLMTFRSGGFSANQPVFARVEGTPRGESLARTLCAALGWAPFVVNGSLAAYHAAACLVSGHLGALFLDASEVLAAQGMPLAEARARLLPLALESLKNAAEHGDGALSGPAVRGDKSTVAKHEAELNAAVREVYTVLSRRISDRTRDSGP